MHWAERALVARNMPRRLAERIILLVVLLFCVGTLVVLSKHAPAALFGYVFLQWSLVLFFRSRQDEAFALWVIYGFTYFVLRVNHDDETLLLVFTSLAHAGAILAHYLARDVLRDAPWLIFVFGAILVIPLQCNNLFFTPILSVVRVFLYVGVSYLEPDGLWIVKQYPLFCKQEAVFVILVWHFALWKWSVRPVQQQVPMVATETHVAPKPQHATPTNPKIVEGTGNSHRGAVLPMTTDDIAHTARNRNASRSDLAQQMLMRIAGANKQN